VAYRLSPALGVSSNVMHRYLTPFVVAAGVAVATPLAVRVPAHALRDEAAMVLVGTALIGLAAAVKRAA